jgi:hypothetical protein|tara:strand:+ start:555 stop:953 length:399 start_codon:yes stop_codon:yes gene_type:complete
MNKLLETMALKKINMDHLDKEKPPPHMTTYRVPKTVYLPIGLLISMTIYLFYSGYQFSKLVSAVQTNQTVLTKLILDYEKHDQKEGHSVMVERVKTLSQIIDSSDEKITDISNAVIKIKTDVAVIKDRTKPE